MAQCLKPAACAGALGPGARMGMGRGMGAPPGGRPSLPMPPDMQMQMMGMHPAMGGRGGAALLMPMQMMGQVPPPLQGSGLKALLVWVVWSSCVSCAALT